MCVFTYTVAKLALEHFPITLAIVTVIGIFGGVAFFGDSK